MKLSRDSEWFAPLILGLGTALVIGLIVALVFIASPPLRDLNKSEQPVFDFSPKPVDVNIGRLKLRIPRNYIRQAAKMANHSTKKILLHAILPDMAPHQQKNWWLFEDKTPAARLVRISIFQAHGSHDEERRFRHLYKNQLIQGSQSDAPAGLQHYLFKQGAGRSNEDVFTGKDHLNRLLFYLCFRPSPISIAPNCSRTFPVAKSVSLTYRFKRSHLENWREIDYRVQGLFQKLNLLSRRGFLKKTISG